MENTVEQAEERAAQSLVVVVPEVLCRGCGGVLKKGETSETCQQCSGG